MRSCYTISIYIWHMTYLKMVWGPILAKAFEGVSIVAWVVTDYDDNRSKKGDDMPRF